MTLITYPTRVHFAQDILEEALHSEIEGAGLRHPLLIGRADDLSDERMACELWERVMAGLARGTTPLRYALPRGMSAAEAVPILQLLTERRAVDLIVAFGDAEAIVLGRKARKMLRARGPRPALYVVPGIDGLPDPCARHAENWTRGLPDVLICDPSVLEGVSPERSYSGALRSLVRGVESYLAAAYNPTADGMALDAFNRCVAMMPHIFDVRDRGGAGADAAIPRELMAAALNAALSQQKGLGPSQRLTAMLMKQCSGLDAAAVAGLLLPGAVAAMPAARDKTDTLGRMMGCAMAEGTGDAARGLRDLLAAVPHHAASLSAMGVTRAHLDAAIAAADASGILPRGAARGVLDAVY